MDISIKSNTKPNTKQFVERVGFIHDNYYDYKETIYINNHVKIKIQCPEHGIFEQRPSDHLRGHGCPKCGINKIKEKETTKQFIQKAINKHGDNCGYEKSTYKGAFEKVEIICNKDKSHGNFWQTPQMFTNRTTISKPSRT